MDKSNNNNNNNNFNLIKKNLSNKINISCVGFNFQFDIILSLNHNQYMVNNINYNNINSLEDLKGKINDNLLSLIKITSNDFLLNTILFINRANIIKTNIKYIIPFISKISEKISFLENIIINIFKREGIEIIPLNLTNKKMQINFILNLIDNNKISSTKKFSIDNICEYSDENNNNNINDKENEKKSNIINEGDIKKIGSLIKALFKCNYILTTTNIINNIIRLFKESKSFENVIDYLRIKKLCIIYNDLIISDYNKKIMSITDIFIFEKELLNKFFITDDEKYKNKNEKMIYKIINYFTNEIEQKEDKTLKVEIIIDQLKEITILQHDSISQLIINQSTKPIFLYECQYNHIREDILINKNYDFLNSVYIGAFLSRLFNKKTFNTCLEAAVNCTKKVIKFLKENDEVKYINNKRNIFKVIIKKNLLHSQSMQNFRNYKLEEQFILDGNNICEMNKKKEYNALFDNNCIYFFNSINRRNLLYKNGFINKDGRIVFDPWRIFISPDMKKERMINYQNKKKELFKIKNKNDITQKFLEKISKAKIAKIDYKSFNIDSFNELNSRKYKKDYYLPSVKEEKNQTFFGKILYHKEIKKDNIIQNVKKRYFKAGSLNKIIYGSKNDIKNFCFNMSINNKRKKNINKFEYNYKNFSVI